MSGEKVQPGGFSPGGGGTGRTAELRDRDKGLWELVNWQYGVISRRQLLERGLTSRQVERRIRTGRLFPLWRGVYSVGRPEPGRMGRWMGALLACGPDAVLSHDSAAALWGFGVDPYGVVEISVPGAVARRRPGIRVFRRSVLGPGDVTEHRRLAVTSPARTLIDQATRLAAPQLERNVNEADKLDRVKADVLYASLEDFRDHPGVAPMRRLLDPLHFRLSDSDLERAMRPIARGVGLPVPETKVWVNGLEVDFFWPELGIVLETDGLRYHRTASAQRRGLQRDQTQLVAGLWPLRFSHWQITREPAHVRKVLRRTVERAREAGQTAVEKRPG